MEQVTKFVGSSRKHALSANRQGIICNECVWILDGVDVKSFGGILFCKFSNEGDVNVASRGTSSVHADHG